MLLIPLYDRVLVQVDPEEKKSLGGIILTENSSEKSNSGIIFAVGAGKPLSNGGLQPLLVVRGDKILFNRYAGIEVTLNNLKLLLLEEKEILAIIKT